MSGGFSGQVSVYGLPSGRLLKVIPVFSQNAENGWGYNEETKPMLQTTYGFIPWDDTHHTEMSMTDGVPDGRWLFINGNNTPRIARIDLTRFETDEIIQIPNSAGGHASPFATPDTKYVVSATRFSVPIPNADVPIDSCKQNFRGTLSFIYADRPGKMDIAFQILMPGYDYDLGHAGKGPRSKTTSLRGSFLRWLISPGRHFTGELAKLGLASMFWQPLEALAQFFALLAACRPDA